MKHTDLIFDCAQENDLEQIVQLLADDELGRSREDNSRPVAHCYKHAFQEIHQDPNNDLLTVRLEKRLIGVLQLTYIPSLSHRGGKRCTIEGVRVSAEFRGDGIGSALIKQAVQMAKEKGCRMVQLTTDKQRPKTVRFYESLGFSATHTGLKMKI